ncbi:MAG: hypothetical protein U0401_35860 [Anaerolineae bacterium]
MLESIQQAVKLHDRYQIEIKLDYELLAGKKTHYQIATYIFIPQSLGITKHTYNKSEFYKDIQNYIRLKTPNLILRDFVENSTSPLQAIERITITKNWASNPEAKTRLIDNFKLTSAMLKSSIREHFILVQTRIAEARPESKINLLIHNLVEEFLVESKKISDKYRSFYATFNLPRVDKQIFTAYKFTDESLSLLIEESAVEMFQIVEEYLKKGFKADFKHKLSDLVSCEIKHRKAQGYNSFIKEGDDNEEYIFRVSALKKYASSVLYLSTAIRREGVELEHILFSIAAGLSMVFATVVAFYFQQQYGNFTFPFFIALVVGYMFKDRIKELGRSFFAKYLQSVLHDRRIMIKTLDGQHKLGILREKMSFIQEKDIPSAILALRNRDQMTDLDNDGQGEHVICYAKDIMLHTETFKDVFVSMPEITGLNDIMRYNIRAYLLKMDEPIQAKSYLDGGQVKTTLCDKVYHLNLIFKYSSSHLEGQEIYKHLRLVLNQQGLKRIEHVPV